MINFSVEQEGYNKAQVEGCIERIGMEYQKLYLDNKVLHSQLEQTQQQLEQTQQQLEQVQQQLEQEQAIVVEASEEKTEAIGRALIDAETLAQNIVKDAREQAWKIITDAQKGLPISENTANPSQLENTEKPSELGDAANTSQSENTEKPSEQGDIAKSSQSEDTEKVSELGDIANPSRSENIEKVFEEEPAEINTEEPEKVPHSRTGRIISNIVFYGVLVMLLIVVFAYTQSGASRSIFGYSYYNILTTSMQSTLPQGSFILVKETPGEELKVGDDITYFKNSNTIVTHRIIGIYEDYEDSGQYGFRTQGTDNPSPDAYITYEGNVIGKVVYHIPMLGFVLEYIASNIWIVLIGFALILALSYFLKVVFTPEKPKEKKQKLR